MPKLVVVVLHRCDVAVVMVSEQVVTRPNDLMFACGFNFAHLPGARNPRPAIRHVP